MDLADVQDLLERLQRNNELLDDERQEMAKYTEVSRSSYLLTYLLTYLLVSLSLFACSYSVQMLTVLVCVIHVDKWRSS